MNVILFANIWTLKGNAKPEAESALLICAQSTGAANAAQEPERVTSNGADL